MTFLSSPTLLAISVGFYMSWSLSYSSVLLSQALDGKIKREKSEGHGEREKLAQTNAVLGRGIIYLCYVCDCGGLRRIQGIWMNIGQFFWKLLCNDNSKNSLTIFKHTNND